MSFSILIRPEAEHEIASAFDWYCAIASDLGDRFLGELDLVFARISENPKAFAVAFGFRRAVVAKFPYCVYFRELTDHVVVVAVFHGRRDPDGLRHRQ